MRILHSILAEFRLLMGNAGDYQEDPRQQVIEIREVTDEAATEEILALFRNSDTHLYYSDIEEALAIDIEQVVRVCGNLMETGKIAVDEID